MIRVLVADDHPAVRVGVERLIQSEPGLVRAGSAGTADEAVRAAERSRPNCALVDYQLPGGGLRLCARLKRLDPTPGVVVYSAFAGNGLAVGACLAGAEALVDKSAEPDRIFEAIRLAASGRRTIRPPTSALARSAEALDADDLAVFGMLVDGTRPPQIAETLQLGRDQVERSVARILEKVEARLNLGPTLVGAAET
jgi:DNA-binding NarL/FixJ family response regulator